MLSDFYSNILSTIRVTGKSIPELLRFGSRLRRENVSQAFLKVDSNILELIKCMTTIKETWFYGYEAH